MTLKSIVLLLMIAFLLPGFAVAGGVTEEDFLVETTEQFLNLCTASPDDPFYREAIGFCHGFLTGAYEYYETAHMGAGGIKLVCFSDPPPSQKQCHQYVHRVGRGASAIRPKKAGRYAVQVPYREMAVQALIER